MWPNSYFPQSYWPASYWPKTGATPEDRPGSASISVAGVGSSSAKVRPLNSSVEHVTAVASVVKL